MGIVKEFHLNEEHDRVESENIHSDRNLVSGRPVRRLLEESGDEDLNQRSNCRI
jgi:hypothetical protein